jgi:hypothetical protein
VERYRSEMEFGDSESKKSIVRTLVASAFLDGDDLTLVANYPGITRNGRHTKWTMLESLQRASGDFHW